MAANYEDGCIFYRPCNGTDGCTLSALGAGSIYVGRPTKYGRIGETKTLLVVTDDSPAWRVAQTENRICEEGKKELMEKHVYFVCPKHLIK